MATIVLVLVAAWSLPAHPCDSTLSLTSAQERSDTGPERLSGPHGRCANAVRPRDQGPLDGLATPRLEPQRPAAGWLMAADHDLPLRGLAVASHRGRAPPSIVLPHQA